MQLIPAIDLRGGTCVRLRNGDFAAETEYEGTPLALAVHYARLGATRLHVVDLDGAREGAPRQLALIRSVAGGGRSQLQVGGGIRERGDLAAVLGAGADRVIVGSRALSEPARVLAWLADVGPRALVLAFDVRIGTDGEPRVATHGWTEQSDITLWQAVAPFASAGLQHALCTDIGRDGTLAGPNCELYREVVVRFPQIAWQASGGIRASADLWALRETGVAAAISGRALLENRLSSAELQPFLPGV